MWTAIVGLRRHVNKLGERIKQHDEQLAGLSCPAFFEGRLSYSTHIPWPSVRKFAIFAHIAESYGYRYDGLDPDMRHGDTPFFVFRRTAGTCERAERTRQEYPAAFTGGKLPDMNSWLFFVWPASWARRDVKLLHARIKVDYASALEQQPLGKWLVGIPAVILVVLAVNGQLNSRGLAFGAALAVGLVALLAVSRLVLSARKKTYRKIVDEEDRKRGTSHRGDGAE